METVGKRIKRLRQAKGLSQGELVRGIVTIEMLDLMEQDKGQPSEYVLEAFVRRLKIPVYTLESGSDADEV